MNSAAYSLNGKPIMTKYEYTRIRGIRLQQLEDGCEPFVIIRENASFIEIFEKEFKEKKLPFILHRTLNGITTPYNACDMIIINY